MQTRYGPKHRAKPAGRHAAQRSRRSRRSRSGRIRAASEQLPEVAGQQASSPAPPEGHVAPREFETSKPNRPIHKPQQPTAASRRMPELSGHEINKPERPVHSPPQTTAAPRRTPEIGRQEASGRTAPGTTAAPPSEDSFFSGDRRATTTRTLDHAPKQEVTGPGSKPPKQSFGQFLKELPVLILVALVIAILVKTFVMQAFFIPSGSMENTLQVGDRVLVVKFLYRFVEPKHPDVVVFASPVGGARPEPERNIFGKVANEIAEGLGLRSSEQDFIKRVIATEGQVVEIKVGSVFVNNQKINEPYRHDLDPLPDYPPTVIPEGAVFVMGDNRGNSEDSRVFGPIPKSSIIGRAFVLIWPLDRVRWLGG